MTVLDTNVLSELMKPEPSRRVVAWVASRPSASLYTTTLTQAEILYGVAVLTPGKRQAKLAEAVQGLFEEDFSGRVLPFDSAAARSFADLAATRRRAGRPISYADAQIASIAHARGASLATRNVDDFEGCGLVVLDPWAP
jgi:predicted nucleic acid-binding protein